jgi:hypothetical protein
MNKCLGFISRQLLTLLIFSCPILFAEEDICIISLGQNCRASELLILFNLKKHSYPFEWKITSFEALYDCLKDDFNDFANPNYFVPYFDQRSPVNKYGIVLAHDFPIVVLGIDKDGKEKTAIDPNWMELLPEVQEKYQRRIDRFREACLSKKKVFFIRYGGIVKEQAKQLTQLIAAKYPCLDFTLMCFTSESEKHPWNIPRVKNYKIKAVAPHEIQPQLRHILLYEKLLKPS